MFPFKKSAAGEKVHLVSQVSETEDLTFVCGKEKGYEKYLDILM